jgi:glc operon protein GlcG
MPFRSLVPILAMSLAAPPVLAQAPRQLGAEAAQAIVAGCARHSTARSQSHAIAVLDAGGHMIAALRMDGNGYGIMAFAVVLPAS